MNILLVYPEYEDAFFNPKKVFKLLGKKAAYPPLGLLTVAAMLPMEWEKKLIDLNCENLRDDHIKWADYVFISAIIGQKKSTRKIINIAHKLGKKVVVGGSLFANGFEEFPDAEVIVLGEAEDILPGLIDDLKNGALKKIYSSEKFPDIKKTPVPLWNLANLSNYNSICIQLSRGCPYDCEFCDVVHLNGRIPRLKSKEQLIAELESLYKLNWRAGVFFADDNFIGQKAIIKNEYLPAIAAWQKKKNFPFILSTQVSINFADDSKLMKLMVDAGFATVFIGIETPDPDCLEECGKYQNKNSNLLESVKKIQNMGFEV
ncbi:MAG: B12-binding domain-containing radical SAM protein, partial [Actinobacteria bacterium]|nr:B12-binding domain-containing radical SAM protein [Actinomycetota bacterium]